jgi:hypothetical protein
VALERVSVKIDGIAQPGVKMTQISRENAEALQSINPPLTKQPCIGNAFETLLRHDEGMALRASGRQAPRRVWD